jgi:hypothetical protein
MSRIERKKFLLTIVLIAAFVSGFGAGTALWQYDAYNYIWGETTSGGSDAG